MRDGFAIAHKVEPLAVGVMVAVFIPDDCEYVMMIVDAVEAEPIPNVFRKERLNLDGVIGAGTKAD